ncbi:SDR family NAD(P)-dependent oxidoreductase [Cetobacterium sp. SF1]|uniref:SDR family NAD(P)-dependent oxidoreductase n=1 Tax=Cetobacterium sp. SF1 TaxID=3417654 RepID=UPI003CF9665D
MNRLSGKNVFITGATKGIGKSTAEAFAEKGANLVILGRTKELLEKLKSDLENKYKINVYTIECDVTKGHDLKEKIEKMPIKNIDILINNAGLALGLDKVYESSLEDYDKVIDTNIKGALYVLNGIVPLMVERNKGHIVNLGSIAGDASYYGGAVYCASKAAIKAITDGLRIELVDKNIRVTNIKPGLVETEFSKVRFKGDEERAKNTYKGIEALTPDDIAEVIVYTCNLPENLQLTEIALMPVHQADGRTVYRG